MRPRFEAMAETLKDAIISIDSDHKGQLESWLLGHGLLPDHSQESDDGKTVFYAAKELSLEQRDDLANIGATVVSEWKPGERQAETNAK
jgi:hypothetical protein